MTDQPKNLDENDVPNPLGTTSATPELPPKPPEIESPVLECYKQRREDIRSFSSLMFQILTLLLTTMTLVIGWGAKDFIADAYRTAMSTSSPRLYAYRQGRGVDHAGKLLPQLSPAELHAELKHTSARFLAMLWRSPTVSVFLSSAVFFLLLLLGMMIVIMYMLQRRRYRTHRMEGEFGMETDAPVFDPVLTISSLSNFGTLIAVLVLLCFAFAVVQTLLGVIWPNRKMWEVYLVLVPLAFTATKLLNVMLLAKQYRGYEQECGWARRWPEADALLTRFLEDALHQNYEFTELASKLAKDIMRACAEAQEHSSQGKTLWRDVVVPSVNAWVVELSKHQQWSWLKGPVHDVVDALRVKGLDRHFR